MLILVFGLIIVGHNFAKSLWSIIVFRVKSLNINIQFWNFINNLIASTYLFTLSLVFSFSYFNHFSLLEQIANQLNSLTQSDGLTNTKLKQASGVVQHHDAITGTEKQHVTNDYLKMLAAGVNEAEQPFTKLIGYSTSIPD